RRADGGGGRSTPPRFRGDRADPRGAAGLVPVGAGLPAVRYRGAVSVDGGDMRKLMLLGVLTIATPAGAQVEGVGKAAVGGAGGGTCRGTTTASTRAGSLFPCLRRPPGPPPVGLHIRRTLT